MTDPMSTQAKPDRWLDTRTPQTRCPFCHHKLDAAGSPEGASPKPGDISVCISCASPLVFGDNLAPRPMSAAEFLALDGKLRAELRRYQAAVRSLDRREMSQDGGRGR